MALINPYTAIDQKVLKRFVGVFWYEYNWKKDPIVWFVFLDNSRNNNNNRTSAKNLWGKICTLQFGRANDRCLWLPERLDDQKMFFLKYCQIARNEKTFGTDL